MSRVGNNPITVPEGVTIDVADNVITVKGKLGEIKQTFSDVLIKFENGVINVERTSESKDHKSKHGLYRSLINNMVIGVSEGFKKELEIVGVGYRAAKSGDGLELQLGFSHPIKVNAPEGITFDVPEPTQIIVSGINKEVVGQVAADIRSYRKPEPYKGKGIRYAGEYVARKAGKAAK